MVKLVTSRVHRCYSAVGGVRNARHERLNDVVHVVSVTLLLVSCGLEVNMFSGLVKLDHHKVALAGGALLALTQLIDLFATSTAHRMFYRVPRHSSKRRPFVETCTKVDAMVGILCLGGALGCVLSAKFGASVRANDVMIGEKAAVFGAMSFALGALVNAVFGIPSVVVKVAAGITRMHNAVVSLFVAGSMGNLIVALLHLMHDPRMEVIRPVLAVGSVASYGIIWIGALLNFARTAVLQQKHPRNQDSSSSEDSSYKAGVGGLFSWFKPNKTSDGGMSSDYDSEDVDEEDGFSSEEETYTRRKSRR